MVKGYMGKILRIDLTTGSITEEFPPESVLRKYLGGTNLSGYYLYKETDENTDPLGEENRLIFMTGPFTLSGVPSSGRHSVAARSPLTGIWGDADVGGTWGIGLKKAGYDGIIFQGISPKPVYLYVSDQGVSLEDASGLWGKDTYDVDTLLKKQHGADIVTQSIGQAGENLVKIACVMTDGSSARAAARCGLGAVMGSKKLKAIAVKGKQKPLLHDEEALRADIKELVTIQVQNRGGMHEHGTAEGLIGNELSGDLPIKNWKQGAWDGKSEKITGEVMTEKYLEKRYFCGNCVVGCGRDIHIKEGPYAGVRGAGPEYETIGCIGSNLLIEDMEAICKGNDLCNRYGIDTISTGGVIGFAMECYEYGLITEKDTEGHSLKWGDPEALLWLIEAITFKRSIGTLLGEGVRTAAEVIGGISKEFAIETKGLEFPAHEPRCFNGTALTYATSNRGACHNSDLGSRFFEKKLTMPEIGLHEAAGIHSIDGKGHMIAKLQDVSGLYDSIKLCKFMVWFNVDNPKILKWINLITGWNMTMEELLEAGEAGYTLRRMYNVRLGISRKDDTLPPRILNQPRGEGGCGDRVPPLNEMLVDYYNAKGWDEFGIPTQETLKRLGLEELCSQ